MARAKLALSYEDEVASAGASSTVFKLHDVARLPSPSDNCAVVTRTLECGSILELDGKRVRLVHTVLEGHRIAVVPIGRGALLTSWGQGFGKALVPVTPGERRT